MFFFNRHHLIKVLASGALLLLLVACTPAQSEPPQSAPNFPVPTINPLFNPAPSTTPLEIGYLTNPTPPQARDGPIAPKNTPVDLVAMQTELSPSPNPTVISTPTSTSTPTAAPSPTPPPNYRRVIIYNDAMDDNWATRYSHQMRINERDPSVQHDGKYSLSFTPLASYGSLLLSVRQTAKEEFLRSEAVGVSFWLYTGDHEVANSDLMVSILGSNRFPFYFPDDHSVESDQEPVFPETRLYYLDINKTIPAQTWVQIEIWLDDLIYDPDYEYVTGVQIKNDEGFLKKVYLDQVELLMAPEEK